MQPIRGWSGLVWSGLVWFGNQLLTAAPHHPPVPRHTVRLSQIFLALSWKLVGWGWWEWGPWRENIPIPRNSVLFGLSECTDVKDLGCLNPHLTE